MVLLNQKGLFIFRTFELKVVIKKSCKTLISTGKTVQSSQIAAGRPTLSVFLQDPEALAQLMKSMPLTNDGKFMLLNDQAEEDGTIHEEGEESEA